MYLIPQDGTLTKQFHGQSLCILFKKNVGSMILLSAGNLRIKIKCYKNEPPYLKVLWQYATDLMQKYSLDFLKKIQTCKKIIKSIFLYKKTLI